MLKHGDILCVNLFPYFNRYAFVKKIDYSLFYSSVTYKNVFYIHSQLSKEAEYCGLSWNARDLLCAPLIFLEWEADNEKLSDHGLSIVANEPASKEELIQFQYKTLPLSSNVGYANPKEFVMPNSFGLENHHNSTSVQAIFWEEELSHIELLSKELVYNIKIRIAFEVKKRKDINFINQKTNEEYTTDELYANLHTDSVSDVYLGEESLLYKPHYQSNAIRIFINNISTGKVKYYVIHDMTYWCVKRYRFSNFDIKFLKDKDIAMEIMHKYLSKDIKKISIKNYDGGLIFDCVDLELAVKVANFYESIFLEEKKYHDIVLGLVEKEL